MDVKNFLLGLLIFLFGFLYIIKDVSDTKKSINVFRIQIYGGLLSFIILGIYLMYTAF